MGQRSSHIRFGFAVLAGILFIGSTTGDLEEAVNGVSASPVVDEVLPVRFTGEAEPENGLGVHLEATRRVGKPGAGSASLAVDVEAELGATSVRVELEASGKARLRSAASQSFEVSADGLLPEIAVDYVVAGGAGAIGVFVVALDANGAELATERAELTLLDAYDEVLSDTIGITALRVEAFDRNEASLLPPEEAADSRAALLDGVALVADVELAVAAAVVAPGPDEVGIEGTVAWTDENGVEHPYRNAEVQIWEDDTASGDDLITTVFTDELGAFGAVVDNDDGPGQGGRDIFIRPRTVGAGFEVKSDGDDVYTLRSPNVDDADGGQTYVFTLVGANNDEPGRAMAVAQAMVLAVPYVTDINGGALRDLDVVYPNGDTLSFYNGTELRIEGVDQYDWDTIHHEYGHFVADEINIENNPGGGHNLGDNLSETRGSKDVGTRLAWGEAWPTYFAISLQREQNAAALNLPRVGDDRYQAFETAASGIDYSMESTAGGGNPGEDNEVSVQRALWDLYDDVDDAGDSDVSLGDVAIWQRLDAADPATFSAGWQALLAPMTPAESSAASCIASNWGMAPSPTAPAQRRSFDSGSTPPTFQWNVGGGGATFPNNEFVVRFTTENFDRVLFQTPTLTAAEYIPTAAEWATITSAREVQWTVVGTQTAAPQTGPYEGCGRTFFAERGSGALFNDANCSGDVLARNDDGSTGAVPIGFTPNFFGSSYSSLFVNNNGNVTLDDQLSEFTPFPLLSTSRVIIAPFFGDVDTRNPGSGVVTYGQTTFGGRPAFCANWVDVGYFSQAIDKRNTFQLLLVDRSNVAPGDFDIIFNFEQIDWETGEASGGSGGLGGSSARSGYASAGFDALELQGSGINGGLLDSNGSTGLVNGSLNTTQLGRYLFRVRNGAATGAAMSGTVTNDVGDPVAGAPVDVCAVSAGCVSTATNAVGEYRVEPVPDGDYMVRVGAPVGTDYNTSTVGPVTVSGADVTVDITLTGPTPPPPGTGISPTRSTGGSVPVVYYNEALVLSTTGCAGASATYTVTGDAGVIASGALVEGSTGSYTATIPPVFPNHGAAVVEITFNCPDPAPDETIRFDIYIDPSGTIFDNRGNPVEGATVTLYRSDFAEGPFDVVPDGSAVMSPSNRQNPMVTAADGRFGWDTIAGYYVVRAEAPGCVSPLDETVAFVETAVLPVPPPQLGIELILDCGEPPTPESLVQSLIDGLEAIDGAPRGIVNGLQSKLDNALASIRRGRNNAACGQLKAFGNQVSGLDGKWLEGIAVENFISTAAEARTLLGCR